MSSGPHPPPSLDWPPSRCLRTRAPTSGMETAVEHIFPPGPWGLSCLGRVVLSFLPA